MHSLDDTKIENSKPYQSLYVKHFYDPDIISIKIFEYFEYQAELMLKELEEELSVLQFDQNSQNKSKYQNQLIKNKLDNISRKIIYNLFLSQLKSSNLISEIHLELNQEIITEYIWIKNNPGVFVSEISRIREYRNEKYENLETSIQDNINIKDVVFSNIKHNKINSQYKTNIAKVEKDFNNLISNFPMSNFSNEAGIVSWILEEFFNQKSENGVYTFNFILSTLSLSVRLECEILRALFRFIKSPESMLNKIENSKETIYDRILKYFESNNYKFAQINKSFLIRSSFNIIDNLYGSFDMEKNLTNSISLLDILLEKQADSSIPINNTYLKNYSKIILKDSSLPLNVYESELDVIQDKFQAGIMVSNLNTLLQNEDYFAYLQFQPFIYFYKYPEIVSKIIEKIINIQEPIKKFISYMKPYLYENKISELSFDSKEVLEFLQIKPNVSDLFGNFKFLCSPLIEFSRALNLEIKTKFKKTIMDINEIFIQNDFVLDFMYSSFEISFYLFHFQTKASPFNSINEVILKLIIQFYVLKCLNDFTPGSNSLNVEEETFVQKIISNERELLDDSKLKLNTTISQYKKIKDNSSFDSLFLKLWNNGKKHLKNYAFENFNVLSKEFSIIIRRLPWILNFDEKNNIFQ